MDGWNESLPAVLVATAELTTLLTRDLSGWPARVITITCDAGADQTRLEDLTIDHGPSQDGPWFTEDLSSAPGITVLSPGASGVFRVTRYDRFLRIRAQGHVEAGKHTDLTINLVAQEV